MKNIVKVPEIFLPEKDYYEWAVVACDQFTSEPKYWEELEKLVGDKPSTLRITFPEAYLGKGDDERIENINKTMQEYVDSSVLSKKINSFILVERESEGKKRIGLMIAIDLETYDWTPFSDVPVKATEGTILSRIPPRVKIRENAPLELPHVMLLCDDREGILLDALYKKRSEYEIAYDTELNMGGGHLRGYIVSDEEEVYKALEILNSKAEKEKKYGRDTAFLFAVGDGNHSLATAKTCWENLKKAGAREDHPARYALCELVNVYDKGLFFEPIHRVLFDVSEEFKNKLSALEGERELVCVGADNIKVSGSAPEIIKTLQNMIEEGIKLNQIGEVDYVHGEKSVREVVGAHKNSMGILMPTIKKDELFAFVLDKGVLPKKAFSMGEANEKRYYMETRKIKE
ncbi:MAG: DUF1015 domain-containing protein [Clostridia bacterium]|nr:DUF1015 domain-containing protein [Clostridia bacterium]